ncbi:hypothetical protein EYF80_043028 [Liparis tanakae]|uniref:Uncharacterized protein n=1 Tax=Liparis tanakae TaxID=230148 RepID=A0A4Z2FZM6_9TELE|nr:hypothetical protein EYF80_043028 [Liparis tanakae]
MLQLEEGAAVEPTASQPLFPDPIPPQTALCYLIKAMPRETGPHRWMRLSEPSTSENHGPDVNEEPTEPGPIPEGVSRTTDRRCLQDHRQKVSPGPQTEDISRTMDRIDPSSFIRSGSIASLLLGDVEETGSSSGLVVVLKVQRVVVVLKASGGQVPHTGQVCVVFSAVALGLTPRHVVVNEDKRGWP